jgi:hypothetical protein
MRENSSGSVFIKKMTGSNTCSRDIISYLKEFTLYTMKYQIYKPNSKNTGCAMSFSVGTSKDGAPALFISAVLQSGWNDSTKKGSFSGNSKDPNKSGNFKMNANEAGEMLSSLRSRIPVVFFHKFNENTTIIKFTPWDKDRQIKEQSGDKTYVSPAFGLSISKNSSSHFKLALEAGETEVLSELLKQFIRWDLEFEANKGEQNSEQEEAKPVAKNPSTKTLAEDDEISDVPF